MKYLLLLISCAVMFASCSTPEQAAQRKLRKAIRLDPDIIRKQTTELRLRDTFYIDTFATAPGFSNETPGFTCDSLYKELHRIKDIADIQREISEGLYLYQDSLIDVLVKLDENGRMKIKTEVKPRTIRLDSIPCIIDTTIVTEGKLITIREKAPIYEYWGFWGMVLFSILMTYLYISEKLKKGKDVNINLKQDASGSNKQH